MKKFTVLAILIASLSSCKDPDPAANTQGPTKIDMFGYMELCSEFHEQVQRNVRVRVYRDEYKGNQVIDYNALVHTYYLNNDMNDQSNYVLEDPDGFGIPITIPDDGSYALRVSATGRDCYNCCNGPSCGWNGGEPIYNDAEIEINKHYRPVTVYMTPYRNKCE